MTVKLDLNREEKRVLLDIIDNQGDIIKRKKDMLGFFSFSKKSEMGEFLNLLKEVYMTVRIALDDDGAMLFPDQIAYALQASVTAELQNIEKGLGIIDIGQIDKLENIVDQVAINPRFVD